MKLFDKLYPKQLLIKSLSRMSSLALNMGVSVSNFICFWWFYQPEEPVELKKYKK